MKDFSMINQNFVEDWLLKIFFTIKYLIFEY